MSSVCTGKDGKEGELENRVLGVVGYVCDGLDLYVYKTSHLAPHIPSSLVRLCPPTTLSLSANISRKHHFKHAAIDQEARGTVSLPRVLPSAMNPPVKRSGRIGSTKSKTGCDTCKSVLTPRLARLLLIYPSQDPAGSLWGGETSLCEMYEHRSTMLLQHCLRAKDHAVTPIAIHTIIASRMARKARLRVLFPSSWPISLWCPGCLFLERLCPTDLPLGTCCLGCSDLAEHPL